MSNVKCPMCNEGEITRKRIQYGLHEAVVEICDKCGWLISPMTSLISDVAENTTDMKQQREQS